MDKKRRVEFVRAMETVARYVNDEGVFEYWLFNGVADGDIDETTTDEELEYYVEDKTFAELMDTFLVLMQKAFEGGLYCDGVVSEALDVNEKYIDLTESSAEYEIKRHLADGWYIHHFGLTLCIMRKETNTNG
jgi:hypothetical protein